ncbi:MAG TPA: pyridoxamine 5'-phosphate oxidase family protein [Humibacter sp.]|jgi:pyridoxine/pyridoxamine 5'-phosphate oxidase|nr:pyridoxamine 5'-phosphate oxidase family protein [Humibacter sp.]
MALDPQSPTEIARFIRECGRGVVATVTSNGHPEAAMVGLVTLNDGTILFNSFSSSRKIANLLAHPRIALVVGVDGAVTVQLEGYATVTEGETRARFAAEYERQSPGSRAASDTMSLVVVRPRWLRVYDTSQEPPVVAEASW